jgi:pilus assembly protein CpaC
LLTLLLAAVPATGVRAEVQEVAPKEAKLKAVVISINGTQIMQHSSKKKLKRVVNRTDNVARVQPVADDPTRVLITGLEPGITRITLTDEDDNDESFDVVVQFDVEYLKTVLKRAVPTANIQPIPAANNTVILTGTIQRAEDVDIVLRTAQSVVLGPERVINALRVAGVQQVQLCVVVAQVTRDKFRRMAFNFTAGENQWFLGSTIGQAVVSTNQLVGRGSTFLGPQAALSGLTGTPNGAATNALFGVLNDSSGFLLFLQALKDESVVKLLAEPRLLTISGRQASFLSGGEQAIPVPAGLGQIGVQFEEFGTRLSFVPIVLGDGKIRLEVEPEVSDLNPAFGTSISGTVVPGRTTQRVHTSIEMEDGQTFVIGGLIQNTVRGTTSKVPWLGDIPFLNPLFSTKAYEENEEELVVMVTAHLVDPMDCQQSPKMLPGQETRSPDDFELFLEGILEAPRGSRQVCPDGRYMPAYKNGPTASTFPCAGDSCGRNGGDGCAAGGETVSGGSAAAVSDSGSAPQGSSSATPAASPAQASGDGSRPGVLPPGAGGRE